MMVCVVSPLLQEKVYPEVPPEGFAVAVPSSQLLPVSSVAVALATGFDAMVTVTQFVVCGPHINPPVVVHVSSL